MWRLENVDMYSGRVPDRLLVDKSMEWSKLRLEKVEGIVPMILFPAREMFCKEDSMLTSMGNIPHSS
jgi:hypothetical protein